jgi:hypothetical protein
MYPVARLLPALALVFATAGAQDKTSTPADQYKALLKTYQLASGGGAANDVERMKMIGRVYKLRYEMEQKFLELVEKYPKDPIALDALIRAVWQINNTPWPAGLVGKPIASVRALDLLRRNHIQSERVGEVCEHISGGFAREYEPFLRATLAKSPHKAVRAQACLSLAHHLTVRQQRVDMLRNQPELTQEFEDLFGKQYLQELLRHDPAKVRRAAEALFEQAVAKYADVKHPDGGTFGEKAGAELFEVQHLAVGKEAPDIEGVDQDGIQFKLSDYRGKVVLLDFWSES